MNRRIQIKIMKLAIAKYKTQANLAVKIKSNQIQISRYATGQRDMPLSLFLTVLNLVGGKIELHDS